MHAPPRARSSTATLTGSNAGPSPRSKSSFLSLRKGSKDKSSAIEAYSSPDSPLTHPTSFDASLGYASSPDTRSHSSKRRERSTVARSTKSHLRDTRHSQASYDSAVDSAVVFPSPDSAESLCTYMTEATNILPSRERHDAPLFPVSRSFARPRADTPPQTFSDFTSSSAYFDSSIVAAPVAGVEFMDALVDGMNGFGDDEVQSPRINGRSRFAIPGHHPLYQPPLPTPPPGVVLGIGASRPPPKPQKSNNATKSSRRRAFPQSNPPRGTPVDASVPISSPLAQPCPSSPSPTNSSPVTSMSHETTSTRPTSPNVNSSVASPASSDDSCWRSTPVSRRPDVPSISEIIQTYAPSSQAHSRPLTTHSQTPSPTVSFRTHNGGLHESAVPEPSDSEADSDLHSHSSMDSVAGEIRRSLRRQKDLYLHMHANAPPLSNRSSIGSDTFNAVSPRSEYPPEPSIYTSSAASTRQPSSPRDCGSFWAATPSSQSQAIAQYLRSARLTTLLKLTRSPHASLSNPLTVSLSDLGDRTGFPVVVFLGLGCVRHIMGLYDEMAECLGIRLITIDRWGLGRTEARPRSMSGVIEWAAVVEEVLDLLRIEQCSIMAHSAGAPYALSFANKVRERVRGSICLLAPWVGGGEAGSYKWLKYVPNTILKTAQAAEWKIQAWMLGKPPSLTFEGIGHIAPSQSPDGHKSKLTLHPNGDTLAVGNSLADRRPSIGSGSWGEYDDLRDFEGRFESRSTLGTPSQFGRQAGNDFGVHTGRKKFSRAFFKRRKGDATAPTPTDERSGSFSPGRRLKALRSMGSLRAKAAASATPRISDSSAPQLPPTLNIECTLSLDDVGLSRTSAWDRNSALTTSDAFYFQTMPGKIARHMKGRRTTSFSSSTLSPRFPPSPPASPAPSSPVPSIFTSPYVSSIPGVRYQAALGSALIAASHAESAKGTHCDLLQVLNRENQSWGFSYASYPHKVCVWYGEKDEKIAENGIRWLEKTMGEDRCQVTVAKGADHGLMYKSGIVVEVLEHFRQYWRDDN